MPEVFDGNYPSSETVFSGNSARNSSGLGAPSETVPARVWASGTVARNGFRYVAGVTVRRGFRFGVYRRGLPFEAVFSAELHAGVVVRRGFRFGVCCRSLPFGVFPIRDLLSVFIVGVYRLKQFSARSFMPGFGG